MSNGGVGKRLRLKAEKKYLYSTQKAPLRLYAEREKISFFLCACTHGAPNKMPAQQFQHTVANCIISGAASASSDSMLLIVVILNVDIVYYAISISKNIAQ